MSVVELKEVVSEVVVGDSPPTTEKKHSINPPWIFILGADCADSAPLEGVTCQ